MDLKEIGQLFITGISGLSLTKEEEEFIQDNNIGGVILFKHNYHDPAQLAELVNSIQKLRDEYPLFICVDQEGGRVKRFQTHFTQFPSMLEIGKHDSPKTTFEVHKMIADELSACGVNLNFSPVCDIFNNPNNTVIGDRAFGTNVEEVQKHVSAAIRGLHTGNILSCAKHFPGHGSTTKDSHFDLPYVKTPLEELNDNELIPFQKASKSRVEFIMMAHLVVDAIDPDVPCTLSPKAYKFLRDKLKYNKIIITDDMEMQAITKFNGIGDACVTALKAGADVVEYRTMEACKEAFFAFKEAIKLQKIAKDDVEDKIKRVRLCKQAHLAEYRPIYIPDLSKKVGTKKHQEFLEKLTQA